MVGTRSRCGRTRPVASRLQPVAANMADPVSDVDVVGPVRDNRTGEDEDEETAKPNPHRRSQTTMVVCMVVLYIVCLTLVMYVIKKQKSARGYSDDVNFSHNQTTTSVSDLDYMQGFCGHPDSDHDEEEASARQGGSIIESVKRTNGSYLRTHVLNAIEKRLKKSDLWCEITVSYYVCNSKIGPYNYTFNLNFDESINVNICNESSPLAEKIKFVEELSGSDVVIAYSECADYIRTEKLPTFADFFIETTRIISPLPLLSTLAVYVYIPQLRNLQGKIIICKLLSDLVYNVWPWIVPDGEPSLVLVCSCVAGITWTTILCYDLWATFNDCLPTAGRTDDNQKFAFYSMIGWGHPTVFGLLILFAILELSNLSEILLLVTLYIIYIFLNILNILFFLFTVKNIKRHNTHNLSLVKKGRQGKTAARGLNLYFRISAQMGIISFLFENIDILMVYSISYDDKIYRAILIGCSFLDNLLYFIILVCNRRVLRLLETKLKYKSSKSFQQVSN